MLAHEPPTAEEEALLATIAADVDSPEPRLVYADWLLQRDDARGELAIAQYRFSREPNDVLAKRISELEMRLAAALREPLTSYDILGPWWLGFIDQLTMHRRLFALGGQVHAWLDRVPLRFVRSLYLAVSDPAAWNTIGRWPHRVHVQHLRYGNQDQTAAVENLRQARTLLPSVRGLHLSSARIPDLAPIAELPLRSLRLDVNELGSDLSVLHRYEHDWQLERLALRFKRSNNEDITPLQPLLAGQVFASVRHLEIAGLPAIPVVESLVASGRIDDLETLSLDFTNIFYFAEQRRRLAELAPRLARVRLETPLTGHYRDGETSIRLARLLDEIGHPEALARLEQVSFAASDADHFRHFAGALHRHGAQPRILAAIDRMKWTRERSRPFFDHTILVFARAVLELELPGTELWNAMKLVIARGLLLDRQIEAALDILSKLPDDDSVRLLRGVAYRKLGDIARMETSLASIEGASCRALAALVADRFEAPAFAASELVDEQALDCAEAAAFAAYRAGDLPLAAARARALVEQLSPNPRPWNNDLRVVVGLCVEGPAVRRPFLETFVRGVRDPASRDELERAIVQFLEAGRDSHTLQ